MKKEAANGFLFRYVHIHLFILGCVLTGNVAEGDSVAEGQAGVEEGVVGRAEELAAQVACGVEALDDLALLGDDTAKLVGQNARGDGRAADMTAGAPEGSMFDLVQILGGLAEVKILALILPKSRSAPFAQSSL